MLDLPSWLSGLIRWLSCLAQAAWVRLPLLPAYRVTFLHAMRLNSGAAIEASVLLNYDRPSHPDWGRLGVVRAAGVDCELTRYHRYFLGWYLYSSGELHELLALKDDLKNELCFNIYSIQSSITDALIPLTDARFNYTAPHCSAVCQQSEFIC